MSIERELLLHLPRLRRYAQALCCARRAGDELLMDAVRQLDLVMLLVALMSRQNRTRLRL
ncbi:MAG: hypothetical protein APF80_05160 [Alphaproteobacteria bacterium BRH_c36]|nr:MAG: hypothetical protein APF80_05160 [Alphaproteobacteria bacterium BRH_c36]